jgi:DNA repair exonuclease SbcCD ATPase subunit
MSRSSTLSDMTVSVENIGGIDETTVTLSHGVNVLAGRNATNRTSFLQAVMAALGSEQVSLKRDAEEGYVELQVDDETYSRRLSREDGEVVYRGSPYLEDSEVADLFAFLLEKNEARRAIELDGDLRDIIMRPVDTDAIRAEINALVEDRLELDKRLDELEELEVTRNQLQERRGEVVSTIEEKRDAIAETEEQIAALDATIQKAKREDEQLEQLRETQSDLEDVRFRLSSERESLSALESELDEFQQMSEELPDSPTSEIEEIDGKIKRIRTEKESLDTRITELQSIIQFNEDVLDEHTELVQISDESANQSSSVTDTLVDQSDRITCWTCGSDVEQQAIESTIDDLRDLRESQLDARNDLSDEISHLKSEKSRLKELVNERQDVNARIERTKEELQNREENIDELERRRDNLVDEIETLEAGIDESSEYEDLLELNKEKNRLEVELDDLEAQLEQIEADLAETESSLEEREQLEQRREELSADISELRGRVEEMETEAVDIFNEHMAELLSELEYENIERIWINRVQREVQDGRRKRIKSMFDLHIVRTTSDGRTYEDAVVNLSESEREIVGLVFALAGYLTHDVAEAVPFMILDSLEAIDSERIADLVDYLQRSVPNIVVALLPDDAAALDDDYHYVRKI